MKKDFEFRIYGPATSGVETTVSSSNLRNAPTVRGQQIDVLKGRTQSQPWEVEINDNGNFFSALIADSSGRMALQGRLCDLRINKDGAGFSVIGTGRIGDVIDHVSHYTVIIQDERMRERTAKIFTKQNVAPGSGSSSQYSGCMLMPARLLGDYSQFRVGSPQGMLADVSSTQGNLAFIRVEYTDAWSAALRELVQNDVKTDARVYDTSTSGNFNYLRATVNDIEYEVSTFDSVFPSSTSDTPEDTVGLKPAESIVADIGIFSSIRQGFWVVDPTTAIVSGTDNARIYLSMPNAEPNELMPLHIGGQTGIPPFQLLKDVYDEVGITYSSSAMQDMIDDPDFGVGWWRITKPVPLASWAEDNIYGPYGVVPLINSSGEVSPKKIHLPQGIASTDLFEFNETNMAQQPTWQHSARDRVTSIRFEYTQERSVWQRPDDGKWPADLIEERVQQVVRTHDRLDAGQAPEKEIVYQLRGVHSAIHPVPGNVGNSGIILWGLDRFADAMSRERFDRFGDGPITGTCVALSTAETVEAGDFVRITLDTFPSPSNQGRGATRIVQIMSRIDTPEGPEFEWLDAGPSLSALTAPTVSVAPATSDAKHCVIATISGASSGTDYQLQWGTGSTEPGSTSWSDWAGQGTTAGDGAIGEQGTNTIRPLPSGTKIWIRGRATAPNRIRSTWSAAANTTTEALQPPTSMSASNTVGNQTVLSWELGSSNSPSYALEILASSGTCPSTGGEGLVRLPARSNTFKVTGLAQDSTYCFGVRHVDDFGGVSSQGTVSVQTTTTPETAPDMLGVGIEVVYGESCT